MDIIPPYKGDRPYGQIQFVYRTEFPYYYLTGFEMVHEYLSASQTPILRSLAQKQLSFPEFGNDPFIFKLIP